MAKRWTKEEEQVHCAELLELYSKQNKTIAEIGTILSISDKTVFKRLKRLEIPTSPGTKLRHFNKRADVIIPALHTSDLAEFFGIFLGDGNLTHWHICVTLGNKELEYAKYVSRLYKNIFNAMPSLRIGKNGYVILQLCSVDLSDWLVNQGMVYNKVKSQVDVPDWILWEKAYMQRFIRGFFDTDGSIYKLRFGIQMSFTNHSRPLLVSLQRMMLLLGYRVSALGAFCFYLTRVDDIERFFKEIQPQNKKHVQRFSALIQSYRAQRAGRPVGGGG